MKIIDLLVKISKGEEVPKEIKYNKLEETKDNVYTYSKKEKDYIYLDEFAENEYFFEQIFNSTIMDLNDEVEIIEEEKEITVINKRYDDELEEYVAETYVNDTYYKEVFNSRYDEMIINKINELIDVINEMRDKELIKIEKNI